MENSSEEKISTWLARIIAADNWRPTANSGISSSAIDLMDMCTQWLELCINTKENESLPSFSLLPHPPSSSPSSPLSLRELAERADPEAREKVSEFVLRYCRLVSQSMCEGLVSRDIDHAQEHMAGKGSEKDDEGEKGRKKKRRKTIGRRKRRMKMTVPGPLTPECCVKCNDVEHVAYWAAGSGLCAEEDRELLMGCLRESKAFLSSWCAVYPCHAVRRALKWGAGMGPVLGIGDYLDTQLCAIVGDLRPRIFTGVAARVWDDIMCETARYTRAWNKRRARWIVVVVFEYFYAGGEGLGAQTLESSSSFQRLKEYLHL